MAKEKKKKNKKKARIIKQRIYMQLPQNIVPGKSLSEAEKRRIYENFLRRAKKKSAHAWFTHGEKPILLRLHLDGSSFDSVQEMLVKYGSYKPIYAPDDIERKNQIGFEVKCKSHLTAGRSHRLRVLFSQFKATLYIKDSL